MIYSIEFIDIFIILFRNELPLIDYIQMIGNFNPGYIHSSFYPAGYFDMYNVNTVQFLREDGAARLEKIEGSRQSLVKSSDEKVVYDLLFKPPTGILNSKKPLLPKTEMIVSFDRASSELALINKSADQETTLDGKAIKLKNVFLRASYYSSPYLRNYFETISANEIPYNYDECQVFQKNLPQGVSTIRLSNLIGGNTPKYLFAGIIESAALNGDYEKSLTNFQRHGISEFDLTLDGYSVNGFPIVSEDESPINVYDKFLQTTNRKFNNSCGEQINPGNFTQFHYLYSHKFCGESSETGWLGVNLKLDAPFETNFTLGKRSICCINLYIFLVVWTCHEIELRIDQFRRIEKLIL